MKFNFEIIDEDRGTKSVSLVPNSDRGIFLAQTPRGVMAVGSICLLGVDQNTIARYEANPEAVKELFGGTPSDSPTVKPFGHVFAHLKLIRPDQPELSPDMVPVTQLTEYEPVMQD